MSIGVGRSTVLAVFMVSFALVTPQVAAQTGDSGSATVTSTTVPTDTPVPSTLPETGSSTTVGGGSSTTVPTSTTTTSIYIPAVPPEFADDPRLPFLVDPGEGDGIDIPLAQRSFDPSSVAVLPERVSQARAQLAVAQADLLSLQHELGVHEARVTELTVRVEALTGSTRVAVERTATARRRLRDHAVAAYVGGSNQPELSVLALSDTADIGVAKLYLSTVMSRQDRLVRAYDRERRSLDERQGLLADELGTEQSKLAQVKLKVEPAMSALQDATQQLAAYEAGAHAYVDGFVFPVAADVEFIDSWGYPRMMGSSYQHWHQGTDIFATYGAPVIAPEEGVIDRLGSGTLGGNKLWVKGRSGTEYYYAHLSAFAPGMANGRVVHAGDLVGFVGDTGNARGTSPHLHFEIHPNGGDAANPYPLLKAAYGSRPFMKATAPPPMPEIPSDTAGSDGDAAGG